MPAKCLIGAVALSAAVAALGQSADAPQPGDWDARFQSTYVWQKKPSFRAPYSGENSLSPEAEKSYSFTSTAFLGFRASPTTEFYFNPELVQGAPLSRLVGLGGLTNGELQKTAGASLKLYRARAFVRHTVDRFVITAGNLAVSDIFDRNTYAHDARTDFLNWGFLTHGAYDFAADARGYTWGLATEYIVENPTNTGEGDWAIRAGRFAMPKESNGLPLDFALLKHYGDQLEIEKGYTIGQHTGRLRLLAYRNVAPMASFSESLAYAQANRVVPELVTSRQTRSKRGWGISLEHTFNPALGLFARLGKHDGAAETYAFAEIDQSASAGVVAKGALWGRTNDSLGLAHLQHGLSASHRAYLAAGGYGFFVGDGRLNYRHERITEVFYRWGIKLPKQNNTALTLGAQHIQNPGYNADRGPVKVVTLRLHTEF